MKNNHLKMMTGPRMMLMMPMTKQHARNKKGLSNSSVPKWSELKKRSARRKRKRDRSKLRRRKDNGRIRKGSIRKR